MQATTDVRVIAATNRDLADRIAQREFREDLYYRLNVLHIKIPPLRERREDIPQFLDHFFRHYAAAQTPLPELIAAAARAALIAYDWPGNVRELKNLVERLVVRSRPAADRRERSAGGSARADPRRSVAQAGDAPPVRSRADELYDKMVVDGESFWSAVHPLFTAQRHDARRHARHHLAGLTQTRGSYRLVLQLFNMPAEDYKAFLNFLRKHQCHMPFFKFRCLPGAGGRRKRPRHARRRITESDPVSAFRSLRHPGHGCPSRGRRGQEAVVSLPHTDYG